MERLTIKEIGKKFVKAAIKLLSKTNMAGTPLGITAAEIAKNQQSDRQGSH